MMKYLILLGIVYFVYRAYFAPKRIERKGNDFPDSIPEKEEDYGEFVDYEEVD